MAFLEDLISAGGAVWEQYLSPTVTAEIPPPPFPVWREVPEADQFRINHGFSVDWREWFVWTNALICVASAKAEFEECGSKQCLHIVEKYAELNFLHAAENCPGGHQGEWDWMANALRKMPDLEMPEYSPARDYGRYQFRIAAWHEWRYLRGSYVPEWELSEEDQEHHNGMGTRIEADMLRDVPVTTVLGMAVLAAQFVNLRTAQLGIEASQVIRALMCIQTGAMSQMAELRVKQINVQLSLAKMFSGVTIKLIGPESLN